MKEEVVVTGASSDINLSEFFTNSCDGFFLMNEYMELSCANRTMQGWLGLQASELESYNLHKIIGMGESKDLFFQHCRLAFTGIPTKFEYLVYSANNAPKWLEITLQRIPETKLMGIARDIDEHKQEIERLKHKFRHDELTGLVNRIEFMRMIDEVRTNVPGQEQALLVIELDHFNVVNDMCGLAAGDDLLCQVANTISSSLNAGEVAARIGGKTFAILCNDSSMDLADMKACGIRDSLTAINFECDGKKFEVGVGIGFTLIRNDFISDKYSAMSEADSACHYARNMGRNHIHAYSLNGNNSYRQQESEWISRIANAFEKERFQLFYQNIKQIDSGERADEHHEILIRMLDDNGEYVTPDEFIPAAEKYNLMPLIDRWVIRTLFARNANLWRTSFNLQQNDISVPMTLCCINISGSSLNDNYFPEFLRDQVALHNIPPQVVCFELTETVAVNDLEKASRLITALRGQGFHFALDDFGKGMSSFSYLQALPVDFLKIDGSLVQNIDTNKTDLCMVEAINRIAHEMGIKTIAEYVKNQKVIDILKVMGINYAQGFGIHRPEPLL